MPPPRLDADRCARGQLVGVNWIALLAQTRTNGILADEMGLGKVTIEGLGVGRWCVGRALAATRGGALARRRDRSSGDDKRGVTHPATPPG